MATRRTFLRSCLGAGMLAASAKPSLAALPKMKITRIRYYEPDRTNPSLSQSDRVILVETDAGITGIGEGGSKDTVEQCGRMLIGEDAARTERLWQLMFRGFFYPAGREKLHALGGLDVALWDIKAKALGVPLYQLLGGQSRDYIECYSTGFPFKGSIGETARACIQAGFRAYRTDAAGPDERGVFDARHAVDVTFEKCRQIREAIGPDGGWAIDFHTRLDRADAVRLATLIESLNPVFVEDPLRSEDAAALHDFRQSVKVPVAVGEQYGARWDISELIERRSIDHARVSIPNVGGVTEFLKIAALCETHFVGLIPHFTGPVSLAALVNSLAVFPGTVLQEVTGAGPRPLPYLPKQVDFHDGKLWPSTAPGLGIEFEPKGVKLIAEITEHAAPIPLYRRPDGSMTNW